MKPYSGKTILLEFKYNPDSKPRRAKVTAAYENGNVDMCFEFKWRDGSVSRSEYQLELQPDGSYRSNTGCEYTVAKLDRRPKPYSVSSQEEGRGPAHVEKFATVEDLQKYVQGRWQGWDYWDGDNCFHNDYATFVVKGAELATLVPAREAW
jgi:hypothetical protein